MFDNTEKQVIAIVEWLRLFIESVGASVIAIGVVIALIGLVRHAISERGKSFTPIRLTLGRYLTLALELQLAADILSTSIAPTWERIGKLAAIAIIRTVLNYFLNKELKDEEASEEPALQGRRKDKAPPPSAGERPS